MSEREQGSIGTNRWFASLSRVLRHDLLRVAEVRRIEAGACIYEQGVPSEAWLACASGSVRINARSSNGKEVTLTYIRPGMWFGDPAVLDGSACLHDAHAHSETCVIAIGRDRLHELLKVHTELYAGLLRLQAFRMRKLFAYHEDLNSLGLRARLAKQIYHLASRYPASDGSNTKVDLQLHQDDLARLLGCSRQRINEHLQWMSRQNIVRTRMGEIVVHDLRALARIGRMVGYPQLPGRFA